MRRTPDVMVILPSVKLASAVLFDLLTEGETFSVEPSPTQDGVWHFWVTATGQQRVVEVALAMGH